VFTCWANRRNAYYKENTGILLQHKRTRQNTRPKGKHYNYVNSKSVKNTYKRKEVI
jgi:hypothetical protein